MHLKTALAIALLSGLIVASIGAPISARKGEIDIVLESDDDTALDELGDALLPELRGDPEIADVEDGLPAARGFLERRVWLFLSQEQLHELRGTVESDAGQVIDNGPVREWIERLKPLYHRTPDG